MDDYKSQFNFFKGFKRQGEGQINTNINLDDMTNVTGWFCVTLVAVIVSISLLI